MQYPTDTALARTSAQLYRRRRWLAGQPEVYNQGRTLGIVVPAVGALGCERLLVHTAASEAAQWQRWYAARGATIGPNLSQVAGGRAAVLAACRRSRADALWPAAWALRPLTAGDPASVTAAVRKLQVRCGLTPLPAWFMNAAEAGVRTTLITDGGHVIGAITVHRVRWPQGTGAMVAATCVAPAARLGGVAVQAARQALVAYLADSEVSRVDGVVAAGDTAALALARQCGMDLDPNLAVFFATAPARRRHRRAGPPATHRAQPCI